MNRNMIAISGMLAGLLLASPSLAGHDDYEYARVLSAEPVFTTHSAPVDREVCWEERRYEPVRRQRSATPVIIGAIIGGVIGNQVSRGSGGFNRRAATAAGAALGGAVGHDTAEYNRHRAGHYEVAGERCTVQREYQSERVLEGYDVAYEYDGEVYYTRTDYHPGESIRVRVAVTPVR